MSIQLYELPQDSHRIAPAGGKQHGLEIIYHMDETRNQPCWLVIIIFRIQKITIIM